MKKRNFILLIILTFTQFHIYSQTQDSISLEYKSAQEAVYSRPFIINTAFPTASIGGYCEANTNYFSTDGVSEGISLEMRRFNIFLFSSPSKGLKFISELEFEHGTEEIRLETAQLDFEIMNELVLRGGIILIPIGMFNIDHDSPKWDIIDRPLVSTKIIPATFSEVGFGLHGRFILSQDIYFTYSAFASNGLTDNIILNNEGRTFLQSGKSQEIFAEDNNGSPAFSGRIASIFNFGEIGISHYSCIYNSYKSEGEKIAEPNTLSISELDLSLKFGEFSIQGEAAYNSIEIPVSISEMFGDKQWGAFIDLMYPVWKFSIPNFKSITLNGIIRLEAIDYNLGKFSSTGLNIYDEIYGFTVGAGIRPSANSVIKFNYKYQWFRDALGNPISRTAGIQAGFATYF